MSFKKAKSKFSSVKKQRQNYSPIYNELECKSNNDDRLIYESLNKHFVPLKKDKKNYSTITIKKFENLVKQVCADLEENKYNNYDDTDSGAECGSNDVEGEDSLGNSIAAGVDTLNDSKIILIIHFKLIFFIGGDGVLIDSSHLLNQSKLSKENEVTLEALVSGNTTSESVATTTVNVNSLSSISENSISSNIFKIKILEFKNDNERPCNFYFLKYFCYIKYYLFFLDINVELDRRQLSAHFKFWLSKFLDLELDNFTIYTHYSEIHEGFDHIVNETDTIGDVFSIVNHVIFFFFI